MTYMNDRMRLLVDLMLQHCGLEMQPVIWSWGTACSMAGRGEFYVCDIVMIRLARLPYYRSYRQYNTELSYHVPGALLTWRSLLQPQLQLTWSSSVSYLSLPGELVWGWVKRPRQQGSCPPAGLESLAVGFCFLQEALGMTLADDLSVLRLQDITQRCQW